MSNTCATITFYDGEVLYFEYCGTSDICTSHIYKTKKELYDNWRKSVWLTCKCGGDELATFSSGYGSSKPMLGRACRKCMAITKDPYAEYFNSLGF